MKHILPIALLALTTATAACGQTYNGTWDRQDRCPASGSCKDKGLNSAYDRYDVGYHSDINRGERHVQDWSYDSNATDYRFQDDYTGRYDSRDSDYGRYDTRYNDRYNVRDSYTDRYDNRSLGRRDNRDQCADGSCAVGGCTDGSCAPGDCEDGQCRVRPVGYRRACQDGDCPIDTPHRAHRSGNFGNRSDRVFDTRYRIGGRDDFRSGRDFGIPTYDRSGAAGINWTTSLQQAADIAARENLPLLVQVTSDDCSYCQKMKREVFTHADVISLLNQNYVTVQVDAGQERAFISQMKITSLPTTLIVAPNRQILERVEGARSAAQLLELLHRNRSAELDEATIVSNIR